MSEEEELLHYGEAMYLINPDGIKEHIPREQWNTQNKELLKEKTNDR